MADESAYIMGKCKRLQMTGQPGNPYLQEIVTKSLQLAKSPELAGNYLSMAIKGINADVIDRHCGGGPAAPRVSVIVLVGDRIVEDQEEWSVVGPRINAIGVGGALWA